MSYAEHTNSLAGPRQYGATRQEEHDDEQADAIVARLTARYGDDALKLYLRLEDEDIRADFDDSARDLADDQIWKRMSPGERLLAEVHQGPDAWLADVTVMEAKYARNGLAKLDGPEEWRPVVGFEDFYEVSSHGKVRSWHRNRVGALMTATMGKRGYITIALKDGETAVRRSLHRIVGEAFIGPLPAGMETRHLDGDATNNRVSNLCYGSRIENEADKELHGTRLRGERHGSAKLTAAQVAEIRASELDAKTLASCFGVSPTTVRHVRSGYSWATEMAS